MAATGGEQAGESDLSGSESRGIHGGGQERRNKRRARRMRCSLDVEGSKPGPTSMAVSWTESHHPGPTSRAVSWEKRGL